ncbi:MAG: hypothetical protein IJ318_03845 [Clostridia bacterium]|nr:hypothetical protein [Clostridia bacterium]
MQSNILLVCLDYNFGARVAKRLSDFFDMFYLDINALISYNLESEQNVVQKAGVEYFDKQVQKIALSAKEYENTIINMPYDLYIKDGNNKEINKKCLSIFLKLSEEALKEQDDARDEEDKLTVPLIAYDELTICMQNCTEYCIELNNTNENDCVKKIINALKTPK